MCYVHNQWYNISCATLYFMYVISVRIPPAWPVLFQASETEGTPQV